MAAGQIDIANDRQLELSRTMLNARRGCDRGP